MVITGFKVINEIKVPFMFDTLTVGHVRPWRSSDSYKQNGDRRFNNGYEIHILLNINGKELEIEGNDSVYINGVPVENDRTENAVKILEHIQTVMMLERTDPPMELIKEQVKPKKKKTK